MDQLLDMLTAGEHLAAPKQGSENRVGGIWLWFHVWVRQDDVDQKICGVAQEGIYDGVDDHRVVGAREQRCKIVGAALVEAASDADETTRIHPAGRGLE